MECKTLTKFGGVGWSIFNPLNKSYDLQSKEINFNYFVFSFNFQYAPAFNECVSEKNMTK